MHHKNRSQLSQYNVAVEEIAATTANSDLFVLQDELKRQKQINIQQAQEMKQKYQECLDALKYERGKNKEYEDILRKLYPQVNLCESLVAQMPTFIERYSNDENKCKQYIANIYNKIQDVIKMLNSI